MWIFDNFMERLVYILPLMPPANSLGNFTIHQKADSWECTCYTVFSSLPCRTEMPLWKLSPKDVYNFKVAGKLFLKAIFNTLCILFRGQTIPWILGGGGGGANPVFLFTLRSGRWPLLAFPQLLSNHGRGLTASVGCQFWEPSFTFGLERVAFPFSRGSSQPRDRSQFSPTVGRFFTSWATREAWKSKGTRNSWRT